MITIICCNSTRIKVTYAYAQIFFSSHFRIRAMDLDTFPKKSKDLPGGNEPRTAVYVRIIDLPNVVQAYSALCLVILWRPSSRNPLSGVEEKQIAISFVRIFFPRSGMFWIFEHFTCVSEIRLEGFLECGMLYFQAISSDGRI